MPESMPSSAVPHLEIRNLTRRFTVRRGMFDARPATLTAVDRVDLAVPRGATLGLVGESGCGKSTLARMAVGLLRPSEGDILLHGRSIWNDAALRVELPDHVQMVFQDPFSSLNPRRTIGSAIADGLVARGRGDRASRGERVRELLEWVGLEPGHARRYPHEFSGGQRQRVAIARALALGPGLVICDEAVSALDVSIQAQILNLLSELRERLGLTYLFISHDLSVVGHVSDEVAVMYLGRVVERAPSSDLFRDPLHPYTRALLEAVPDPDPALRRDVPPLSGDMPSPMNPPSGCCFHPRCPEAFAPCATRTPVLREVRPSCFAACHLHGE